MPGAGQEAEDGVRGKLSWNLYWGLLEQSRAGKPTEDYLVGRVLADPELYRWSLVTWHSALGQLGAEGILAWCTR